MAVRRKALGDDHLSTADTLNNMALVYVNQGRYDAAVDAYDAAGRAYSSSYGPDHDKTVDALERAAAARAAA